MLPITFLSLETHSGPYENWPLKTRLLANGLENGKYVPGFVIEAQYKLDDGYLLITSHDCPHEESNNFLLLNDAFEIAAKKKLGMMYQTFLLQKHSAVSDTEIAVDYGDCLVYLLAIKPKWFGGQKLQLTKQN